MKKMYVSWLVVVLLLSWLVVQPILAADVPWDEIVQWVQEIERLAIDSSSRAVKITINNPTSTYLIKEHVTSGLPFPDRFCHASEFLNLTDWQGNTVPLQYEVLNYFWSGYIRQVMLRAMIPILPTGQSQYGLSCQKESPPPLSGIEIWDEKEADTLHVYTGDREFAFSISQFDFFQMVRIHQDVFLVEDSQTGIELRDTVGVIYRPADMDLTWEVRGPLQSVLRAEGFLRSESEQDIVRLTLWFYFYWDSGQVRVLANLHNPRAAVHPNNVWDLGSTGSVYFEDMSLLVDVDYEVLFDDFLWEEGDEAQSTVLVDYDLIYQDSSGRSNWQSQAHVDKDGFVSTEFSGFRHIQDGNLLYEGSQAGGFMELWPTFFIEPVIRFGVRDFWQNFPKALEVRMADPQIRVGLFPGEAVGSFELQGGEMKTHEVFFDFYGGSDPPPETMAQRQTLVDEPLVFLADPRWYVGSGVFGRTALQNLDAFLDYEETALASITPTGDIPRTFITQRDPQDLYGWRHFGCAMADHETDCGYQSFDVPYSLYNNQYDYSGSAFKQFARSGDLRWLRFGSETARHIADIDVYHTNLDVPVYNGGMFWHTTHDVNAGRATHRTYPSSAVGSGCTAYTSGGPALDHLYARSLLYNYFFFGDPVARRVLDELADYAVRRYELDGPRHDGRALANYLQLLTDMWVLTHDYLFLQKITLAVEEVESFSWQGGNGQWGEAMLVVSLGRMLDEFALVSYQGKAHDSAVVGIAQWVDSALKNYHPDRGGALEFMFLDAFLYAYRYARTDSTLLDTAERIYRAVLSAPWYQGGPTRTYLTAKTMAFFIGYGQEYLAWQQPVVIGQSPVAFIYPPAWIVRPDEPVVLDGSVSHDPDGDALNFSWWQVSGPAQATLSDTSAPQLEFQSSVIGQYEIALRVDDGTLVSMPFVVIVEVSEAGFDVGRLIEILLSRVEGQSRPKRPVLKAGR